MSIQEEQKEEEGFAKQNDAGISTSQVDSSPQEDENSPEIIEDTPPDHPWRRQKLALQIPARADVDANKDFVQIDMPPTPNSTPKRVNFSPLPSPFVNKVSGSPGPSSSKTKSTIKNLFPKLSFKYLNSSSEMHKVATLTATRQKPVIRRTFSLTNLLTTRLKNTSSLPTSPICHSNPETMHGANSIDLLNSLKEGRQVPIHRSHSVPVLNKDGSVCLGSVIRVISSTPRAMERTVSVTSCTSPKDGIDGSDDEGEDIAPEEAVCRICLVELGEGTDTLKMECSCKGDLARPTKSVL